MSTSLSAKLLARIAGPLVFALVLLGMHPEGLSAEAAGVLATTAWMAIWWITDAIPIAATALLPIVLFPLTGAATMADTTAQYGHRYIFLYLGGFLIALGIEKWGLHRRIALTIINLIGTSIVRIILGFMIATASLSMWISNTATTVMMLPIGMAIITQLRERRQADDVDDQTFGSALMLAIAYSASIGGIGTLVGTPPNLVLAGAVQELYGIEISFAQWFIFGFPISLVLLVTCWLYLTRFAFRFQTQSFPGGREEVREQLAELGPMSREEKIILAVFLATASLWIGRSFLQQQLHLFPRLDDTMIAVAAGLFLFVLPVRRQPRQTSETALLDWEDTKNLPWGIVFLFGGGMALAEGFTSSGLAHWLGAQTTLLEQASLLILVLLLVSAVNFLTEVTSNLATTSMLMPILASMAVAMDVHPFLLMVGATVAASCAFMLPVATPPNAVVFGSGCLRIREMVRTGLWMNLLSIAVLTIAVYFLLPALWGIDITRFPPDWP